ncbi:MAG: shikimate kinase [Proteobacteria bacterium]|nr:shikimate kinase [Pseudomonadota bacterium]
MPDNHFPDTISLIGMPGAGKSTVGVLLAKMTGRGFRDTDLDIQLHARATLQEILEREGHLSLRAIEEQILLEIPLEQSIISTGGSVVYSETAMRRLSAAGPVVYLKSDFETLEKRVSATPDRGIASSAEHSFADIFAERVPLYQQYADISIDTADATAEEVAMAVLQILREP